MPPVNIVVAVDDDMGIGRAGGIPWRIPDDMRRFSALTQGDGDNAVVMGRKTWESLPPAYRPLPDRQNVVVSRTQDAFDGALSARSVEGALSQVAGCGAVWICGGAEIYRDALPFADAVYATHVWGSHACDTFFPWVLTPEADVHTREQNGHAFGYQKHPLRP